MNVRVLLVSRFRELSMKVSALSRDALTIVHVAWLSDAIRRLKRNDFQAVMADLDLPDAKGLEALHALVGAAPPFADPRLGGCPGVSADEDGGARSTGLFAKTPPRCGHTHACIA